MLRFFSLFCWLFAAQLVLASSYINLPKAYDEASGPYGFVIDAQNRPHLLIANMRPRAYHEIEAEEAGGELVPVLSHTVKMKSGWVETPLAINWDTVSDYSLVRDALGEHVYFVSVDDSGVIDVSLWAETGFELLAEIASELRGYKATDEVVVPFKICAIGTADDLWIAVIETRTGLVKAIRCDEKGRVEEVYGYDASGLEEIDEETGDFYSAAWSLAWSEQVPELVLEKQWLGMDRNPLLVLKPDGGKLLLAQLLPGLESGSIGDEGSQIAELFSEQTLFLFGKLGPESACLLGGNYGGLQFFEKHEGQAWKHLTLDASSSPECVLKIDAEGNPWILYDTQRGSGRTTSLALAHREEGTWVFEDIAPIAVSGVLDFAPDGTLWVAYHDLDAVFIMNKVGVEWRREMVAGGGAGGGLVSDLDVGKDGKVRVLIGAREGLMMLTRESGGVWERRLVSTIGVEGWFEDSFRLYEGGDVHVDFWELEGGMYHLNRAVMGEGGKAIQPLSLMSKKRFEWLFSGAESAIHRSSGRAFLNTDWDLGFGIGYDDFAIDMRPQVNEVPIKQRLIEESNYNVLAFSGEGGGMAVMCPQKGRVAYSSNVWFCFQNDGDPEVLSSGGDQYLFFEELNFSETIISAAIQSWDNGWYAALGSSSGTVNLVRQDDFDQDIKQESFEVGEGIRSLSFVEGRTALLIEVDSDIQGFTKTLQYWYPSDEGWVKEDIASSVAFKMYAQGFSWRSRDESRVYVSYWDAGRNASVLAVRTVDGQWHFEDLPTRLP